MSGVAALFESVEMVMDSLLAAGYLARRKVAATLFLAGKMKKPLLVEGPAGVGKTELARALAGALNTELIRLQCYPGLDESKALYEWNYQRQLLFIQSQKSDWQEVKSGVYTPDFLLDRPVLKAFTSPTPVVLLIDELDKGDDELESFLLEALSDYQLSIPEYGTITARHIPYVIITSNNSRDLGDAMKRRCLHLYIHYPDPEEEEALIQINLPGISKLLSRQVAKFVSLIRKMALKKHPGVAESVDWARALITIGASGLTPGAAQDTLSALLKYEDDVLKVTEKLDGLIASPWSGEKTKTTGITPPIPTTGPETAGHCKETDLSRFDF
jgi:MoxR-like ATPase